MSMGSHQSAAMISDVWLTPPLDNQGARSVRSGPLFRAAAPAMGNGEPAHRPAGGWPLSTMGRLRLVQSTLQQGGREMAAAHV